MTKEIIKMLPNRVRRNYLGGSRIDAFRGNPGQPDGERPEEWLCSTVEAKNPGLPPVENEGYACFLEKGEPKRLVNEITENPQHYTGKDTFTSLSFLAKWLDSSIRLHMQAHPKKEFSKKYLGCDYGKFEAYYVLSIRDTVKEPYIRLGFQRPDISKELWTRIVETQDIPEMDSCFEKIPVKPGDVIYIPGGMPHAIGEGIFMLELMEPSDLVVRCEYVREGIEVPPPARFMNRGLEFCMDIFDYTPYTSEEIREKFFLKPQTVEEEEGFRKELLVPSAISGCFDAYRITVKGEKTLKKDKRYGVMVATKGKGVVETKDGELSVAPLDNFFIAAETEEIVLRSEEGGELEVCLICPPSEK